MPWSFGRPIMEPITECSERRQHATMTSEEQEEEEGTHVIFFPSAAAATVVRQAEMPRNARAPQGPHE